VAQQNKSYIGILASTDNQATWGELQFQNWQGGLGNNGGSPPFLQDSFDANVTHLKGRQSPLNGFSFGFTCTFSRS
jgi:hypothetical protein